MKKINLIYTIAGIYGEIFDHYPTIYERTKIRNMARTIFDDLVKQNENFDDGKIKERIELYLNSIINSIICYVFKKYFQFKFFSEFVFMFTFSCLFSCSTFNYSYVRLD
ncbi:hypothetical protein DERF_008982 [Dermatophagoides farinae]|uniref:Uncharacterized protein n=1 Tax=Dermatophagoides farinae TaxID=6954 RepID=A0A922HVZ0_DERFA|nr:hypothetical protein DERF_008982 [Dermatophagoides farinae]